MIETKAFNDVIAERERQQSSKGYSIAHDDEYEQNELIRAANGYLSHVVERSWTYKELDEDTYQSDEVPDFWPWDDSYWNPKNPRQDLVRAAALIIAEIERIDRKAQGEGHE